MSSAKNAVKNAADAALGRAIKKCNVDVEAKWFLVDWMKPGHAPNTGTLGKFTHTHQDYLDSIGVLGTFYSDVPDNPGSLPSEQGADAIADISKFYDWRRGACRSILYISDTVLEGDGSSVASNDLAVNQAINVANANNVTVFAHRCDPYTGVIFGGINQTDCDPDYHKLCNATGGSAITSGLPTQHLYEELISDAICNCGKGCKEVQVPEFKPCISIKWGDGKKDSFETDDFEVLCITVCNCYSNIGFCDFQIGKIEVLTSSGKRPKNLPDGSPSVELIPMGPICFGDILPCKDGNQSCVSREIAIHTRGAVEGEYQIKISGICYQVKFDYEEETCFKLELCKS